MPDPAIDEFFQKRKDDWLKKSVKPSMTSEDKQKLEGECEKKFAFEQWLPDAAKRAGQISIATHPCTFSHPSARKNKNGYVSSIIANAQRRADGYVRTGNVGADSDALGNAAALDVYKFLTLTMQDGKTLLEHIENDSALAKELLTISSENYQVLKDGFLAMAGSDSDRITSSKIKQIYFPVDDSYHLLSVLSNSGLIYELRRRIDKLRFSEKQKDIRTKKRNDEFSEEGFSEIYNITTIGYGGTKPQNISVLNNQFGGKARLLLSIPPVIAKREIKFPKYNFFTNTIRYYDVREPLEKLHKIFTTGLDSAIPRKNLESGRDHRVEEILDIVIQRIIAIRGVANEQYREKSSELPHHQKVWLCPQYDDERKQQEDWLDQVCADIARWISMAYTKVIRKPMALGPAERDYLKAMVETHKEALR